MSWGCSGSTGSRAAARRPPAPMSSYPFDDVLRLRGAREPAARLRRHRRGSRHRAARVPRDDAGRERAVLPHSRVRAARRRQLQAARRIPAARRRLGRDARSRHLEGVLARARHRLAPAARAYPDAAAEETAEAERAPPRSAAAARGAWRARGCSRASGSASFCRMTASRTMAALGEAILVYLGALAGAADACADRGRRRRAPSRRTCPAPTDAHPNWRRRLSMPLDDLLAGPEMARIAALVTEARRQSAADKQAAQQPPSRPDERDGRGSGRYPRHLPAAIPPGVHVPRRRGARPVPRPARHQPYLRLAADAGAARLDARLRHRQPRPAQPRDRHRGRVRGAGRGAGGARHGARSSISCRTTWGSAAPTTPGGSTSSNGARTRPMRRFSTSTGTRSAKI